MSNDKHGEACASNKNRALYDERMLNFIKAAVSLSIWRRAQHWAQDIRINYYGTPRVGSVVIGRHARYTISRDTELQVLKNGNFSTRSAFPLSITSQPRGCNAFSPANKATGSHGGSHSQP